VSELVSDGAIWI